MDLPEQLLPPRDGDHYSGLWTHGLPAGANGALLAPRSPIDGRVTCQIRAASPPQVAEAVLSAQHAFQLWRRVPPPRRGELVRQIGDLVREHKAELAKLITLEAGKIAAEAEGEIQEWIDVCEFAVGLSRQLYGLTIATERPEHCLIEQWHPLGPVGVISAFNFPAAVWAWNAMIGLVCGDPIIWKPSEQTPLTALACNQIVTLAGAAFGVDAPMGLSTVVIGEADVGQALAADRGVPLVSATGSVPMGRAVAEVVGARLGRSLLELGGNNGMIVTHSADLQIAVRAITFAAVGTCGQRCTSLRRLFVHASIADELVERLRTIYQSLPVGDPRDPGTLVGPLVGERRYMPCRLASLQRMTRGANWCAVASV